MKMHLHVPTYAKYRHPQMWLQHCWHTCI